MFGTRGGHPAAFTFGPDEGSARPHAGPQKEADQDFASGQRRLAFMSASNCDVANVVAERPSESLIA
jgi:hypothetical protein